MAKYLDSEHLQEYFRKTAGGNPCSRFAGAGALENVSGIGMVIFQRACQICVARAGTRHTPFCCYLRANLANGHDLFPVRPVPVLDHHCERTADGLSMLLSAPKTNLVSLDLHTAAAAITTLRPLQLLL